MSQVETTAAKKLSTFDNALAAAQSATDITLPVQMLRAFIAVATNEGKSVSDLADLVGANLSTMSRHLLDLGQFNRKKEPGHGLIEPKQDPMNLRVKNYVLTPKGKLVLKNIMNAL